MDGNRNIMEGDFERVGGGGWAMQGFKYSKSCCNKLSLSAGLIMFESHLSNDSSVCIAFGRDINGLLASESQSISFV